MELKLAFIGFGSVARAFARMLNERQRRLETEYRLTWKTIAIATAAHGCVTSTAGINLVEAAESIERGNQLAELPQSISRSDPIDVLDHCDADIVFETTPLNAENGEPGVSYVRRAFECGSHVITANKGPIAFAYSELRTLANEHGVSFLFEGTVMDGTPVFNLAETCLPGVTVLGFSGVLNSTTNLILTGMEAGRSFEESLAEAQRRGIAEANAIYDIDGWDAAVKAVALANVLMDADLRPIDVDRTGIREVTLEDLKEAASSGMALRLVARGQRSGDAIRLSVRPERVPLGSPLGSVQGTSNVLVLETDLMGEIAIIENDPRVEQTAYALLTDMIRIHEIMRRSKPESSV